MAEEKYAYVIIGAGLAGASAVEGIRERDRSGPILLFGSEPHLPYDRPPLTKKLWFGKKKVEDIFLHDKAFYDRSGVTVRTGAVVTGIDAKARTVTDSEGRTCGFGKLLLATGGVPRKLPIPGGDLEGISYFRTLDDYLRLREGSGEGRSAVVIGGGFIGSEIAAALSMNRVDVTMLFPEPYLVQRVFPESLGRAIQAAYRTKGVRIFAGEKPTMVGRKGERFVIVTDSGREIESDMVIAGIGVTPSVDLARQAGLRTGDGIIVDEYLESSVPGIYAAGDAALFPYQALGRQMRVEHWDNAVTQGKWAGRNMAGGHEPYTHMPYFFSDLFEFGYEAVGEVDSRLETYTDWTVENRKGVIYYLRDGKVRGAMMCDIWEKVDAARELIRKGVTKEHLKGAIAEAEKMAG